MNVKEKLKNVRERITKEANQATKKVKGIARDGLKKTKETSHHKKHEIEALNAFYKSLTSEFKGATSLYELQEYDDEKSSKIKFKNNFSTIWDEASKNEKFKKYIKNPSPTHKLSTLKKWYDFINKKLKEKNNFWSPNAKLCETKKLNTLYSDEMFDTKLRNLLNPFSNQQDSKNFKVSKLSSLYNCTKISTKDGGCRGNWKKVQDEINSLKERTKQYFEEWGQEQEEQERELGEELEQLEDEDEFTEEDSDDSEIPDDDQDEDIEEVEKTKKRKSKRKKLKPIILRKKRIKVKLPK